MSASTCRHMFLRYRQLTSPIISKSGQSLRNGVMPPGTIVHVGMEAEVPRPPTARGRHFECYGLSHRFHPLELNVSMSRYGNPPQVALLSPSSLSRTGRTPARSSSWQYYAKLQSRAVLVGTRLEIRGVLRDLTGEEHPWEIRIGRKSDKRSRKD